MLLEGKESTQASIFNSVIECLQNRRLKYHTNSKDPEVLEFSLLVTERMLPCHALAKITDMDIQLFVFLPIRATAENFSDVVNNLLHINNNMTLGSFCVDLHTGELSYRFCMTCWRVTPSPREVSFMLDVVTKAIERYAGYLI